LRKPFDGLVSAANRENGWVDWIRTAELPKFATAIPDRYGLVASSDLPRSDTIEDHGD